MQKASNENYKNIRCPYCETIYKEKDLDFELIGNNTKLYYCSKFECQEEFLEGLIIKHKKYAKNRNKLGFE